MLKWVFIFLGISIVSGFLGFTNVSAASRGMAKILFYIFVVLFLAAAVALFVVKTPG